MQRKSTKAIAEMLGLSSATVSNVINNKGRVSELTRARVLAALESNGFVLNTAAISLKTGRSTLVGVMVNDIANPFYAEVIGSLETTLSAAGYNTVLSQTHDDCLRQRQMITELLGRGVAGLVINPAAGSAAEDFELLRKLGVPVVFYVRNIPGSGFDCVHLDDYGAGRSIARHLIETGAKHIAIVGGLSDTTTFVNRKEGLIDGLASVPYDTEVCAILPGAITREFGAKTTAALLRSCPQTDAIVFHNDLVASGALGALRDFGRTPGKDITVIGFDNLAISQTSWPQMTSVDPGLVEIGEVTARRMLARIEGLEEPASSISIATRLVVRGSSCRLI